MPERKRHNIMFEVKNVSIYIGTKCIIKSLSFTLHKNDKLAIIGEEGDGKSTLLKSLLGICDYATVTGQIFKHNQSIGYLGQVVEEEILLQTGKEFLFASVEDYYKKIHDFSIYKELFSIKEDLLERKLHTFSGGELVKVRLLKIMLDQASILFLDEPTNDLDLETLLWLEKFLTQVSIPVLYISHDEVLLSHTATSILHLERLKKKQECRHTYVKMDYNSYIDMRLQRIKKETQLAKYSSSIFQKKQEKLQKLIQIVAYKQNTISRKDPHGAKVLKKKMHSLKSQEKRLNNIEKCEYPEIEESISFHFSSGVVPSTKVILDLFLPTLEVNGVVLARNIVMQVMGGEHVCIVGKNGCGKTTLLKQIYEILRKRKDIMLGYMPQNYEEELLKYATPLAYIKQFISDMTKARMYLGNMKLTQEEITGSMHHLSNGSKAKLFFACFVLRNTDCLLLDEPTRNVSPLSNPYIRKELAHFKGTIISISHDRKFIQEVCTSIYQWNEKGLEKL